MNINHHDMVSSSRCHNIDGDDLITEILLRLPPIAVHRFRRVCKQWYSLISNPDFLRTHSSPSSPFLLHNSSTTPSDHDHQLLVFYNFRVFESVPRVEFVPLTQFEHEEEQEQEQEVVHRKTPPALIKLFHGFSPPAGDDYNLIDSCNGLFMFHSNIGGTYYICNPITKHYIKLPDYDMMSLISEIDESTLVFTTHTNFVFDHHHPATIYLSYKIIRLLLRGNGCWEIYVYSSQTSSWKLLRTTIPNPTAARGFKRLYSSKTSSWRLLRTRIPSPTGERFFRSILLNGVLYLLYWITSEDVSICFDVEKECVWHLPLPPKPENSLRNCLYFGECGGRLRLIERFLDTCKLGWEKYCYILPWGFDIMEMEPQQQQHQHQQQQDRVRCAWTVKYRVNITRVYDVFSAEYPSVIHCYKTKNRRGNEEEVLLLRLNVRSIVSLNLTSNKFIKEILVNPERTQMIHQARPVDIHVVIRLTDEIDDRLVYKIDENQNREQDKA